MNQATFRNGATGSFELQNAATFARGAGQGFFDNQGLLRKTAAGTSIFELDFITSGSVEIDAGALEYRAPGTGRYEQTAGSSQVAVGAELIATTLDLSGGTLRVDGELKGNAGPVPQATITGGALTGDGTVRATNLTTSSAGTLGGTLTIDGNVLSGGILAPTGLLDVDGGLTLQAAGTFTAQLAGTTPGTEYGQVASVSTATLGGALEVRRAPGFLPQIGQSFTLLDAPTLGSFDTVMLPTGYQWQVTEDPVVISVTGSFLIFADGFESGTTASWSASSP